LNQGTSSQRRGGDPGKPPSPVRSAARDGASVVVRARESRVHGEGRQSTRAAPRPQGKAMYVASQSDKDWLLNVQRKLYTRSQENPAYVFRKLWGLVTDSRNLRMAFARVAGNRGRRTAGVDRVTVRKVLVQQGVEEFVGGVRFTGTPGAQNACLVH